MNLSSSQIKRLRAMAHKLKLKPVVIVGQNGLGDNLQIEIGNALAHHELIKLRIPALGKTGKRELAADICARHEAQLVEAIGNVIVIYRRNQEKDRFAAALAS